VSDQHLRRFAAYLGMPPIAAFVLAGLLELADFIETLRSSNNGWKKLWRRLPAVQLRHKLVLFLRIWTNWLLR